MKGVYFDRELLLDQLTSDVKISMNINDLIPITVYSRIDAIQTTNNPTDHLRFLFYQLFIHQYCLNSSSTLNKNDFLGIIRGYYTSNRYELKQINKFDDEYNSSKDVSSWILRDCFLRRMLTQSLSTLNIQILFSLRFFIKDLFKTMSEKALTTNSKQNGFGRSGNGRLTNEQMYYRGQALGKETFLKIKSNIGKKNIYSNDYFIFCFCIGEILSMNNFMLASKDRQDSLALIRQNISTTDFVYRVLFEIKVPSDYSLQKQRPFIDVSYLNDYKKSSDEDKDIFSVLFFIGSIFRINTVEFDINNDCYIIQLTLYNEKTNEDFSQVFTFLNNTKRTNTENTITLANLLRQISPNSAEQFYKHLLKENSESLSKLECYRGLGLCSYSQDDYDRALNYFEKALHLKPNDKLIKSSLHNSMGLVYARQDQIDEALNHFNSALEHSSLPLHVACVHHNLALVYSKQGQYEDELDHYEKALQIRTRQLPAHHLQMASLHNNIGIAYSDLHEYDQALSSLRQALEMRLKLLSATHIDVARSYANIGTVYAKTQEFRMALEYFNKAHLLFEQQPQIPQQDIDQLNRNIKIVNDILR
jgi:tetratricopeptide (TPR) repeat protein